MKPHTTRLHNILLAPALALMSACAPSRELEPPPPAPAATTTQEELDTPQINSVRPRVIEYDGDDRDSMAGSGSRGGWGELDEDLGAAGVELSPLPRWIRN